MIHQGCHYKLHGASIFLGFNELESQLLLMIYSLCSKHSQTKSFFHILATRKLAQVQGNQRSSGWWGNQGNWLQKKFEK